jgi:kynurenine formamidase
VSIDQSVQFIRETGRRLSNWGRWGAEDQRGTLNFITPESIRHAASLVKTGRTIRLGLNYDVDGPQIPSPSGRFNPIHVMTRHAGDAECCAEPAPLHFGYADDIVTMPLQCSTQWDGLAHIFYDQKIYNGYASNTVLGGGATKNGIELLCDGVVGRGVLLDVARFKGTDILPPGHVITAPELDACAAAQNVAIRPGDILLVRTGTMRRLLAGDKPGYMNQSANPGLGFQTLDWIRRIQIAALACDNYAVEVRPSEVEGIRLPFHHVAIRDMGLLLGEIFNFEDVSAACAADGVYEFLFTGSPLPITGAVGSPVNPLAIK